MEDIRTSAMALYAGGWRSSDKDELINEYMLTQEEVHEICEIFADLETCRDIVPITHE